MITSINEFRRYKKLKPNTPDPINSTAMGPNDVFVFGSNTEGKHGGGAAKAAMQYYGAIWDRREAYRDVHTLLSLSTIPAMNL